MKRLEKYDMTSSLHDKSRWERAGYLVTLLMAAASCTSTGAMSALIVAGALVLMGERIFTSSWPHFDKKIALAVLIYIAVQSLLCFASVDMAFSAKAVFGEAYRFLPLFVAGAYVRDSHEVRSVLLAFAVSTFLNSFVALKHAADLIAVGRFFRGSDIISWGLATASHTHLGSQILLSLPLLFLSAADDALKKKWRVFSVFVLIFSLFMLVLSGSRGAWAAFPCVLILFLLLVKKYKKAVLIVSTVVILAPFAMAVVHPPFEARLTSFTNVNHKYNRERVLMWRSSVRMWKRYPVFGVGKDNFGLMYNKKFISKRAKERAPDPKNPRSGHGHPHNNFLKWLTEGGVVGLLSFILLHGYFALRLFRMHRDAQGSMTLSYGAAGLLMLTGLQLAGLTDTNMNQVPIMRVYWLMMGTLLAADLIRQGDPPSKKTLKTE